MRITKTHGETKENFNKKIRCPLIIRCTIFLQRIIKGQRIFPTSIRKLSKN